MFKSIKNYLWLGIAITSPWILFFITKNKMYFHDQSSICVIAQGLLSGLDMYRHYFNEKLPLLYYSYSYLLSFLEVNIQSVRVITYFIFSATFGLIFYLLEVSKSKNYLKLFFLCLSLFFLATSKSFNAATEPTLALIYLLSIVLIVKEDLILPPKRNVIVGLLMGIALGFRQHSILPALILLVSPWHKASRLYYVAGVALGIFCWIFYFIQHDLLYEMLWSTFLFTLKNEHIPSYIQPIGFLKSSFIAVFILFIFAYYLLKDTPKRWLPFFAISCSLSFFIRFGNTRLWPAFILLCAVIILHMSLLNKRKVKFKPLYFNTTLVLIVVLIFPYKLLSEINNDKLDKSNLMANFVKERTKVYDTILAYPGDPGLYCLAERRPASKFYFLAPWLASPEIINTVVRDIKMQKPKMIILRQDFENDHSFNAIHEEIRARYQKYKGREDLSRYAIYELN